MSNKATRAEKKEKMKKPVSSPATTPEPAALDAATKEMTEVPSEKKKEPLKKTVPVTYAKFKVTLTDKERLYFNFDHIKSQVGDIDFAKKFLSHHIAENHGIKLTAECWDKLASTVKFDEAEVAQFANKNKSLEGTKSYNDVMGLLKSEIGDAADNLSYDAVSITRVLMRMATGKKTIVNDLQCTTMQSAKYLAANNAGDEFEDRGARIATKTEVLNKVSTFRSLKGKFYIETPKTPPSE